jgi:predicted AAA+ superfamily ATPase
MLQRIQEAFPESDKALYVSIDSPYFQAHQLFEFAASFHRQGGEILFLDEIHKYPDWSVHIKTIYDSLPGLKIVFSGSSLLKISRQKGDLSRRAVIYHLQGLSFREYLNFSVNRSFEPLSLEKILKDHQKLANGINTNLKILRLFKDYLETGYYPFFMEGESSYQIKLREVLNHVLEADLPYVSGIEARQTAKLKKLLYLLSTAVPFVPNIVKLAEATEISRPKLYEYLECLRNARLLNLIRREGKGYSVLTKPDKIYLENSNLMLAITDHFNPGTLREIFFANQMFNAFSDSAFLQESIVSTERGDFLVLSKYTFEVGGRSKKYDQIKNIKNSFIAADDIETGTGNKIPLWLFGFLY